MGMTPPRLLRVLKVEILALSTLLAAGALVGWATLGVAVNDDVEYEVMTTDDLEPFRSAFNADSDHIRLVLLVGPT